MATTSQLSGGGVFGAPNAAQVAAIAGNLIGAGYPSGTYVWLHDGASLANALLTVDLIYFYPFVLRQAVSWRGLFQICTALGAGSAIKSAVWRNDPTLGRPTGLPIVGQNTGFDTTSTGNKTAAFTAVNVPAGVYWGGSKFTGTAPQVLVASAANVNQNVATAAPNGANAAMPQGYTAADAYAKDIMAFDATSAALTEVASARIPLIGMIVA